MGWTNPRYIGAFLAAGLLSGSCSPEAEPVHQAETDPAMAKALEDPILIDPDLTDRNLAGSAIDIAPPDGSLPSHELGPKALADARAAALTEIGGPGRMRSAPPPSAGGEVNRRDPRGSAACTGTVEYTMQWAARMPSAFPVYPLGAVQQAEGSNAPQCAFRAISFITPVPAGEVVDYYYTRALAAGFSAARFGAGGEDVLSGERGRASYVVKVRDAGGGATEVELLTAGF